MRRTIPLLLAPLLLATPLAAQESASSNEIEEEPSPPEVPPAVKAMLDAAMRAGDEAAVNAIAKYAKIGDRPIAPPTTGGMSGARPRSAACARPGSSISSRAAPSWAAMSTPATRRRWG